ncbi:MAG: hypothetical protein WB392_07910 [Methanotrichaceae archaeon]
MIFWHRRDARPLELEKKINLRRLELQAAKEILAEIFRVRPEDIEDLIHCRLEERSWTSEQAPISDELWPVSFCLGE